jgi:hypothetical protein
LLRRRKERNKFIFKKYYMSPIKAIKPGPKPKKEDGTPDKRRRVTPDTKPKHPGLKPHKHKPGD